MSFPHNFMTASLVKKDPLFKQQMALASPPMAPSHSFSTWVSTASTWPAIIADVSKPILGADFLRQTDLLVDLTRERLIDAQTFYSTAAKSSRKQAVGLSYVAPPSPYRSLLESFPSLTTPCFKRSEVQHDVKHHIVTEGPPVYVRFRRLSPEKLQIAKKHSKMIPNSQ